MDILIFIGINRVLSTNHLKHLIAYVVQHRFVELAMRIRVPGKTTADVHE